MMLVSARQFWWWPGGGAGGTYFGTGVASCTMPTVLYGLKVPALLCRLVTTLGIVSTCPGLRLCELDKPLASAMTYHRLESPYWLSAIDCRVSVLDSTTYCPASLAG